MTDKMSGDGDGATSKWKFRPPPRGVAKENLRRCKVNVAEECCQLGDLCDEAHSDQELQEWQLRWEEDHRYIALLQFYQQEMSSK